MTRDKEGNSQNNDQRKSPMITLADSVDHSMIGDPGALAKGGCLSRIIILAIIIIGLLILSRCSY